MSSERKVSFWWPCLFLWLLVANSCGTNGAIRDIAKAIREVPSCPRSAP